MTSERFVNTVLAVAAIGVLGLMARREFAAPVRPAGPAAESTSRVPGWPRLIDSADAKTPVTAGRVPVLVFTDFECPFCQRMDSALARFADQEPGVIALSVVHLPLTTLHRYAIPAARAFECAAAQGDGRAMATRLYARQRDFATLEWGELGDALPEPARFRACVIDTTQTPRIAAGQAVAQQLGLDHTPVVVVNGWRIEPPGPTQVLEAIRAVQQGRDPRHGR